MLTLFLLQYSLSTGSPVEIVTLGNFNEIREATPQDTSTPRNQKDTRLETVPESALALIRYITGYILLVIVMHYGLLLYYIEGNIAKHYLSVMISTVVLCSSFVVIVFYWMKKFKYLP